MHCFGTSFAAELVDKMGLERLRSYHLLTRPIMVLPMQRSRTIGLDQLGPAACTGFD